MPHPTPEPPSSVADLMAELGRAIAAIGRARKLTSPQTDQITTQELLALYRHERTVVRRLRRRHRQWRAQIRISDAALLAADTARELA